MRVHGHWRGTDLASGDACLWLLSVIFTSLANAGRMRSIAGLVIGPPLVSNFSSKERRACVR